MFIVMLFTVLKTWKQPNWIKKMRHIHTMEYCSAIGKNETLPGTASWMDLENIMVSEISQM